MKPSEVLRRAARIAEEVPYRGSGLNENRCGCGAIMDVCHGILYEIASEYFNLCRPSEYAGGAWFGDYAFENKQGKAHRVLALCLAAAIAESEGQ